MKHSKILSVLLILAVAAAGGVQTLAAIPHVHGRDFNHSSHPECPVHQVQNHSIQIVDAPAPDLPVPACRAESAEPFSSVFVYQTHLLQEYFRAPPASF